MKISIREATEDDLPAVLALYGQPGFGDEKLLDPAAAREILAQFGRYPNYRLFVATEASAPGKVIGSFAMLVMHNLAHMGTPSAIVEDVVVDEARRGLGIGRRMMDEAVALAQKSGCYKLALSSNQRRAGAHAFYESLGFERHGYSFVIDPQSV